MRETRLQRICDGLATAGFAGLVFVALLSMADVGLRSLGLPRVPGLHDLKEVVLALIVACCFPLGLLKGNNVTVRILRLTLGNRGRAWLECLAAFVTLGFFAIVVVSLGMVVHDVSRAGRTTSTLEMPMAPWLWLIEAVIVFALIVQLVVCAQCVRRVMRPESGGAHTP